MKGNHLWLLMPSIVMILVAWIAQTSNIDNLKLSAVTVSFVIMKILEYSFRGIVTEMVRKNKRTKKVVFCPPKKLISRQGYDKMTHLFLLSYFLCW
jgi:hypothetical protein